MITTHVYQDHEGRWVWERIADDGRRLLSEPLRYADNQALLNREVTSRLNRLARMTSEWPVLALKPRSTER